MIGDKLNFMIVDFDAQMQYFMMRVANFEPLYLKQFWVVSVLIGLEIS